MKRKLSALLLRGIKLPFDSPEEEALQIARTKMKRVGVSPAGLHFRVYKKSLDARRRGEFSYVYTVLVTAEQPFTLEEEALTRVSATPHSTKAPTWEKGEERLSHPPFVVGMGPAGLFAALTLAEEGYRPVLIDRGGDVSERVASVSRFVKDGTLDTESNIQFGAGGAGTFSDGKLVTRVNDPLCQYVLTRLVEFGAPEEILYRAKPHVGTDILRDVVQRVLSRIESLGGEVRYRTRLDDLVESTDGVTLTLTRNGARDTVTAGALILAIGHSARDTFGMLQRRGLAMSVKPFSVGVRIEHLREDIDRALYGELAGHPLLGPAEYALSDTTRERGVYTFCMCPGGEVVAAASEEGGVVVNGMSEHARAARNSNSAVLVSVTPADVGGSIEGAIAFQRDIERAAFTAGGGDFAAPVQTVGDFLGGTWGTAPTRVQPSYRGGNVKEADMNRVLPHFVCEGLAHALTSFDKKLRGFAASDALLTGAETRTSAPLRILRGEQYTALGHAHVYPVGEGAGYAGGIMSAALDGLHAAAALMQRYAPER